MLGNGMEKLRSGKPNPSDKLRSSVGSAGRVSDIDGNGIVSVGSLQAVNYPIGVAVGRAAIAPDGGAPFAAGAFARMPRMILT